jgi:hypothetical protein
MHANIIRGRHKVYFGRTVHVDWALIGRIMVCTMITNVLYLCTIIITTTNVTYLRSINIYLGIIIILSYNNYWYHYY